MDFVVFGLHLLIGQRGQLVLANEFDVLIVSLPFGILASSDGSFFSFLLFPPFFLVLFPPFPPGQCSRVVLDVHLETESFFQPDQFPTL